MDLTLSGHTHGGQIRVGGRAPIHHSRFGYEQGWFSEGACRLYVGRGIGVTVLPIRIDAPPEIPVVRFCKSAVTQATAPSQCGMESSGRSKEAAALETMALR